MKKFIKLQIFMGLFLSLFIPDIALSQDYQGGAGLTNGDPYVPVRVNSGYGFDTGVKGGSALEQLENMTGTKVNTSSSNTRTVAPVSAPKTISSAAAFQHDMNMMVASSITSAFLNFIFSDNSKSNQQAIEAQRQQAALLAARAAAEKRYNDSIAQAKYEKMMQSYKLLNDPNGLQIKTLSTGNLAFKSLDNLSAPMTMNERLQQNLIKRGINVTWDYNSWAQVPSNTYKMEETQVPQELSGADKYLNDAINKIETFQGGRIAALAGRYMLNIKQETMSYLKDASDAALSGNIARMDEVGNVDLRARISSNALYSTGKQTANAYYEQGKDFVSGAINDAKDEVNFGLMKSGGLELLKNKNIYSRVSDEWKVGLRKY
jgi:hypothetical protein